MERKVNILKKFPGTMRDQESFVNREGGERVGSSWLFLSRPSFQISIMVFFLTLIDRILF